MIKNALLLTFLGLLSLGLVSCKQAEAMPADAVSLKVTGMT